MQRRFFRFSKYEWEKCFRLASSYPESSKRGSLLSVYKQEILVEGRVVSNESLVATVIWLPWQRKGVRWYLRSGALWFLFVAFAFLDSPKAYGGAYAVASV